MSVSQQDVVDYIKNMKLSEVKGLIDILEQELGVEASAPVMAVGAVGPAATAEPVEEKTEFDVILTGYPDAKKIAVIKAVRALTGLGLKEAKEAVEGLPAKIKEGVSKEDAEAAKTALAEAEATVELK